MRTFGSLLLAALLVSTSPAVLAAQEQQPFVHRGVANDAKRYEEYVRANWKAVAKKAPDLRLAAEKLMSSDPRGASRLYAEAASADGKSPENWLGLAQALLAVKADPDKGSEQYDLPVNASGAAYRAYELATDKALKARALAVLGQAMERRSYWRPAIDAMKSSLALVDNASVREAYEKLRENHGFRMTDYRTEQDAATPRVCIQFSETLSRGQIDFAKFISVDGKDPQSVTVEGSQLCIEGVQHGQRYEVQVRAGLPSDVSENLEKGITLAIYVPDRKPAVHFTGKSYVLPSRGQQGIPLVSINTTKVNVDVYRIGDRNLASALTSDFDRQLQAYELDQIRAATGSEVYSGQLEVQSKLNDEVTTAFPVSEAVGQLQPGVYVLSAKPADVTEGDSWRSVATQWFIVSDLGLTSFSGTDGVHAFVRSLATAEPIEGANVRLVARNNEVLATVKTDKNGYVRFDAGQSRGVGGSQPQILVAEKGAGEYAFLDLQANAFDLSDRGVKGRDAPGPIDAYLYAERGVYRPGEEVNFSAVCTERDGCRGHAADDAHRLASGWREYGRYTLTDQGIGGRSLNLRLGGSVSTGTWRAKLHTDPAEEPVTQMTFLVEDYVPEKLELTLKEGAGKLAPEDKKTIDVAGRFLYGPPAAGLVVEGEIAVKASKQGLAGYDGYQFGLADETVSPVREPLKETVETAEDGTAKIDVTLPQITKTARPLEATVIVKMREPSGRAIERSLVLPVDLGETRIGIKPNYEGQGFKEDAAATFDIVKLSPEGKPEAGKLNWQLFKLDTSWQWFSRDGVWAYEAQTISRKVTQGEIEALASGAAKISTNLTYGRYRLEVSAADQGAVISTLVFTAGWYSGNETAESPEMLDVALDKETYKIGETAKLRIASKLGGKAMVAVLGQGLISTQEVELPKGGGDVAIKVGEDWGPGAYATALLYRPMDEAAKRMPSRAIGVRWIGVDQAPRTLKVSMKTEGIVPSGAKLSVPVKVEGLTPGEDARITVAAVDVGILNLTRFEVPAPELHFYEQRKLSLELRDFYGRLIDGMRAERGKLRQGGDGEEDGGLNGSPPAEETLSMFSGIVTVGSDGTATVDFALPSFNGTARLMAVAWSKDKVGHGTSDVIIRDKVALSAGVPRFLTLGDEARFNLSIHNVEGEAGTYKAAVSDTTNGADTKVAERDVALKAGERKAEEITVKPTEVGLHTFNLKVTGPKGIDISRLITLDVKPPAGDVKRTTVQSLAAKGGKLSLSKDLLAGLIASRSRVMLSVGPAARLDVPGVLAALDRYPYGCAEQTVSRALPLVYANAVAVQVGLAQDKDIKERVQAAIERLFEMQDSSGAFGLWGPSGSDLWLTAYVTDFLTRAKEAGFPVRQLPFTQALDRLQNFALNGQDFDRGGEERAYALYVLARNQRAAVGELRYYADTRLDRFTSPLAKAQLGAALAMVGDKERAERAFGAALDSFQANSMPLARSDFGSQLRDGAALVTLASETGIVKTERPRLINVISEAYQKRTYTSTQEQAWMLLAAHALGEQAKDAKITLGGAPVEGPVYRGLTAKDLEKGLVVTNDGEAPIDAVVTVVGSSLTPEPAIAKGFTIERQFFNLDGTPADLGKDAAVANVKQNDRFVVVVKVTSDESSGRVLLVDHLPSGLEIENPHLVSSGDTSSLDWVKSDIDPEHTEFRDDKLVAAFNLSQTKSSSSGEGGEAGEGGDVTPETDTATPSGDQANVQKAPLAAATVAYIVRAVTPGAYVHPAATIEDMYRPERYARTSAGKLTVK